jgi:hypothetical protein
MAGLSRAQERNLDIRRLNKKVEANGLASSSQYDRRMFGGE